MNNFLKASGELKEQILLTITDYQDIELIKKLNSLYVNLVDVENILEDFFKD